MGAMNPTPGNLSASTQADPTRSVADAGGGGGRAPSWWRWVRARATLVFGVLVFALALVALHHLLADFQYDEVMDHLRSLPWTAVFAALFLTILSYLTLAGYDLSALHYVGTRLPFRTVLYASFTGYAISNNLGFSMLSGGSVRYRVYSAAGLPVADVARVIVFCSVTFTVGLCAVGSAGFFLQPHMVARLLHLPVVVVQIIAGLLIALLFGTLVMSALLHRGIRVGRWTVEVPSPGLVLMQIVISSADILLTAGALFVLLPPHELGFSAFLGIYCAALLAGIISHVPGGIGIFESIILIGLAGRVPAAGVLGALVVYRTIYYLLPMVLATLMLAIGELAEHRRRAVHFFHLAARVADRMVPTATAGLVFAVGAVMLFSGATPAEQWRLELLHGPLPLSLIEASHILGSLCGLGLLLLARGLHRRLDAAWRLATAFLAAAVVLSLGKGLDFEEAIFAGLVLLALLPCRSAFYRRARLANLRFSHGWLIGVAGAVAAAVWVALFSFKHVDYSGALWWQFALSADASRSLRAMALVVVGVAGIWLYLALRPAPPRPRPASPADFDRIARLLATTGRTDASLAFLGDKSLLFSDSGRGFLMYGVQDRSWIALGDPVGSAGEQTELIWRFRELCDRNGANPAFYRVRPATLPLYLDVGLIPVRLGADAQVPLADFSLDDPGRDGLRAIDRQGVESGLAFEVIPAGQAAAEMASLAAVSDAWLRRRGLAEKGWSVGRFDPAYLAWFDIAVLRRQGRPVAFASFWKGAPGTGIGVDLLRHGDDAPDFAEDLLLIRLILWARDRGYKTLDLGMVPLSAAEGRELAPVWSRFGAFLLHESERGEDFAALRRAREKFSPVWEPRYLVCPDGLAPARILAEAAALTAGDKLAAATRRAARELPA